MVSVHILGLRGGRGSGPVSDEMRLGAVVSGEAPTGRYTLGLRDGWDRQRPVSLAVNAPNAVAPLVAVAKRSGNPVAQEHDPEAKRLSLREPPGPRSARPGAADDVKGGHPAPRHTQFISQAGSS